MIIERFDKQLDENGQPLLDENGDFVMILVESIYVEDLIDENIVGGRRNNNLNTQQTNTNVEDINIVDVKNIDNKLNNINKLSKIKYFLKYIYSILFN